MKEISIPDTARRGWYYKLSQVVVSSILRVYFSYESRGVSNIPESKGAVIATNHTSLLDPPLVAVDLPRPVFFMAKQSLHDIPLVGSFIRAYHAFSVNRGGFNRGAMRKAVEVLKKGNLLLLFPEGTRSRDGDLHGFKAGIGKILLEAGVGVVPGYVDGAFESLPPGNWWPRPRNISVNFGEYREYDCLRDDEINRKNYRKIADDIQEAVANLAEQSKTKK